MQSHKNLHIYLQPLVHPSYFQMQRSTLYGAGGPTEIHMCSFEYYAQIEKIPVGAGTKNALKYTINLPPFPKP